MRLKKQCIFWLTILLPFSSCLTDFTSNEDSSKGIIKSEEIDDSYNQDTVVQNCLELNSDVLADILATCNFASDLKATNVSLSWTREVTPKVFQAKHFANLSSVLSLTFDDPFESEFAPNTFEGLTSLKSLKFKSGSNVLPDDLLLWLPNLTSLTIEGPLSQFKIFQSLTHLEDLSIKVKIFEETKMLPDSLFNNLSNIRSLELTSDKLLGIPQTRFLHALKNLQRVKIQAHVRQISRETFRGLLNITSINMSSNSLTEIGHNWFESQVNLKELYLDHNNISDIAHEPFRKNCKLEVLDLSHNRITKIQKNLIGGLTGLKRLYLNHNYVKFINPNIFNEASVLNVGENRLTDKRSIRSYNKNLELIDLSHNILSGVFIPQESFLNALVVNLSSNNITWIDVDFIDLQSSFHHLNLVILKLNQNPIDCNQCDVPDLRKFEQDDKYRIRLEMFNLTCARPTVLKGRLITTLTKNEMKCPLGDVACPPGCDCTFLPQEKHPRLVFNCSNLGLIEAPSIPEVYSVCPSGCSCTFHRTEERPSFLFSLDCRIKNKDFSLINETEPQCPEGCSCLRSTIYICKIQSSSQIHESPLQHCPASCMCHFEQSWHTNIVMKWCGEPEVKQLPTLSGLFASNCTRRMLQQSHLLFLACSSLGRDIILNFGQPDLSLELDLSHNNLTAFPKMDKGGYQNVSKLNLNDNQLNSFDGNNIFQSLVSLRLDQNKFQKINKQAFSRLEGLKELYLGSNDWICKCSESDLYNFTLTSLEKGILKDFPRTKCSNGVLLKNLEMYCEQRRSMLRVFLVTAVGLSFAILAIFCALNSHLVRINLFSEVWFWRIIPEDDKDRDKVYDAFIAYSHADEDFVEETLVPKLESGDHPYKFCVHVRDWELGAQIMNEIRKSVDQSRKTIIVLSRGFLLSRWAMKEFKIAHQTANNEGRTNGVITILMEDKTDIESAGNKEIRAYVNTNPYLHKDDPDFWKKLRKALQSPLSSRN